MDKDITYERYMAYPNRFIELIQKQAKEGLTIEEKRELKKKCEKMIEKLDWELKRG